jgi:hypothetical protein
MLIARQQGERGGADRPPEAAVVVEAPDDRRGPRCGRRGDDRSMYLRGSADA